MLTHLLRPAILVVGLSSLAGAQGTPAVLEKILDEGKNNSHVWDTLIYISEEIGTRLTGSSGLAEANEWTRSEFERLGLTNAHLAPWGEIPVRFDRGPSRAGMVVPTERPFEFTTRSWGAGTDGPVRGPVFMMPTTQEEFDSIGDSLEGAWVLVESRRRGRRSRDADDEGQDEARALAEKLRAAIDEAPLAGKISSSRNDLVITGGERGWRELTMDTLPTAVEITVRRSDFEAMQELLKAGESVEVEADLDHRFSAGPITLNNTVAEIRGSEWPEQVVILSAHLDSWDGPGSMGTQDNGTGSSVMLEAARILMAAGVQPRRTIRFCLWTGEEQGLLGSKGYVDALSEEELSRISAAFVDDGGTNYQGGLVCIESMLPMLETAIGPAVEAFPELEVLNVVRDAMPRGGASDHASFNRKGVPGFFWIEKGKGGLEGKNYGFIHHTQHDTPRYAVKEYLVQSATTSAVTAYNLAMADELLPREVREEGEDAAPKPAPAKTIAGPMTGIWDVDMMLGEGAEPLKAHLTFEHYVGGGFGGVSQSAMGEVKIIKGHFNPKTGEGTFAFAMDGAEGTSRFRLADGQVKGELFMFGETSGSYMGKRQETVKSPLNGVWVGTFEEMDATFTLTLALYPNGVVKGRYKSSQSDSPLVGGKWNEKTGVLTYEYEYPHAGMLPVEARLKDGKLVGAINGSMGFEAIKND
ncbi:MAG TPA: M20/M25/M40 family metallo-hydrolase [Planctomycetota bacterium]|nr:M20/M25/M40 family metallo-hydrolase [Planctomycetota bacterium]